MNKTALVVAAFAFALSSCGGKRAKYEPGSRIGALYWMSGDWEAVTGTERVDEHWTLPAGSMMLGSSRTVDGKNTTFFEFMRIEEDAAGKVTMTPAPRGQPSVSFALVKSEKGEAIFENLKHDFPTRIVYRREPDGTLLARAEGMRDGKQEIVEARLKPSKPVRASKKPK